MKGNNEIRVSMFSGFSKHLDDCPLVKKMDEISTGKYLMQVERIRTLTREGRIEEAARRKRQLPGFTVSATYRARRLAETIVAYNDILILDLDKLGEEEFTRCRRAAEESPYTLFAFRSPSGNGLKLGVHFRGEEAERLRKELFARKEIAFGQLESYHKRMFELCREHYEGLCRVEVDPSGSDIGRLCFSSYDPGMYVNAAAIDALEIPRAVILPPGKDAGTPPPPKKEVAKEGVPGEKAPVIDPVMRMQFQQCVNSVRRTIKFVHGQRDTFLFTLGNRCYRKGLIEEVAIALTEEVFGGQPGIDIPEIIRNAYRYISQTNRQEEESRKPEAIRIAEYLEAEYEIRRNIVLERLEYRKRETEDPFAVVRNEDVNTLYLNAQYAGIPCRPNIVRAVVNSRVARPFNPFEEYFGRLPAWDGCTDHIDRLAQTIGTNNQEFWRDCFKRWIVGMVACALDDEKENQLALIIKGGQGKGKSTWIRHLLPPELKHYYRNGMIIPDNKDHMIFLSQRILINLEEFEGMKPQEISALKRLIAQDSITERKAYGENADFYVRRCSFIASTNEPRFLEDITGTRRFPTVTAMQIDYRTPVNHAGVYAQAMHLWKSGFRYWYEEEEFRDINKHNREYVVSSAEEELFYIHFRQPLPADLSVRWLPVSAILTHLVIYGKIQQSRYNSRTLIKILERDGFRTRLSSNNIHEYEVVQIEAGEIARNMSGR